MLLLLLACAPVEEPPPQDTEVSLTPERGFALQAENSAGRTGYAFFPEGWDRAPLPIVLLFHGTGGSGESFTAHFETDASERGFAIVAPDSRISPGGLLTWEVGTEPGEITEDVGHAGACLDEALLELESDGRVLFAGFSGGGSSAPYVASLDERANAFAVLHGGVFPNGLGDHQVPGWFSTGLDDELRPPEMVEDDAAALIDAGWSDIEVHLYEGGHAIGNEEREALLSWWLAL